MHALVASMKRGLGFVRVWDLGFMRTLVKLRTSDAQAVQPDLGRKTLRSNEVLTYSPF